LVGVLVVIIGVVSYYIWQGTVSDDDIAPGNKVDDKINVNNGEIDNVLIG